MKTETCEDEPRLIDDSRQWKNPVELLFGKKFKLEVLEACVRTMLLGELASFTVDKSVSIFIFFTVLYIKCSSYLKLDVKRGI